MGRNVRVFVCVCVREREGTHRDKGQKGSHGCSQPCTDTAQYCSKRHLWVPHPTLVAQLGLTAQAPRLWAPPAAFRVRVHLPYGEVLAGVWL